MCIKRGGSVACGGGLYSSFAIGTYGKQLESDTFARMITDFDEHNDCIAFTAVPSSSCSPMSAAIEPLLPGSLSGVDYGAALGTYM